MTITIDDDDNILDWDMVILQNPQSQLCLRRQRE